MATTYGRDIFADDSLESGRFASELVLVAQNCKHRLITVRGTLIGGEEEADYGLGIEAKLGNTTTAQEAAALPGQIDNELKKDPRVLSTSSAVSSVQNGPEVEWTVNTTVMTEAGNFTLAISELTIDIVGLGGTA